MPDEDTEPDPRAAAKQEVRDSQEAVHAARLRLRDAELALEKILRGDG